MKGYAKTLHEFISGQQIQFVIPVYQRNYDWLIENCDQLFSDLIKLSRSDRHSHLCFKNYWQKIELATENQPTKFLRDYLTIQQQLQRPVRLSNIYYEWKKYMDGHDRKEELVKMLDYAHYYQQVTEAKYIVH